MGELIGKTLSLIALIALCFCIGWLVGADDVLAECRASGSVQILDKSLDCTRH